VNTIDFILQRVEPSSLALAASDLYPFVSGDGSLDIRDLTIAVQAIVRGTWPDDVALPPAYSLPDVGAGKQGAPVVVSLTSEENELVLGIQTGVALRALQLRLHVDGATEAPILTLGDPGGPSAAGRSDIDRKNGASILIYRPDGGVIEPGTYTIARIPRAARGDVRTEYATAIDDGNQRRWVEVRNLDPDLVESPDLPKEFEVLPSFPKPFALSEAQQLTIPVRLPEDGDVAVTIYDLLGRRLSHVAARGSAGENRLTWNGRDYAGRAVPPGIYLVSVENGRLRHTMSVVVIR
jgi:hypothetical protein